MHQAQANNMMDTSLSAATEDRIAALEKKVREAIKKIDKLDVVKGKTVMIHIEEDL